MKFSTYEIIGMAAVFVLFIATVFVLRTESNFARLSGSASQTASIGTVRVGEENQAGTIQDAVNSAVRDGAVRDLIINDIERGRGAIVNEGDRVRVHYQGRLPDGTQFDSSRDRGEPFIFTVGAGRVIAGWEEGVRGMREGGTRMLVIPPELGYGNRSVGRIPANSTLVFTIELLAIE